jgi:hypothetical protein
MLGGKQIVPKLPRKVGFSFLIRVIREGMRFVSVVLKHSGSSCRTDGKWVTINLLAANQQVDYGRCSWIPLGVILRFRE